MLELNFKLDDYGLTTEDIVERRALIYKRVSSDPQEDNTSLETQEEECRKFANHLGIPVLTVFSDVMTGIVYRERKGLTAMREEYKNLSDKGYRVIVLVWVLDRLSRDQIHFSVLIDEMRHHNVILLCIKEKFDDNPLGCLSSSLMSFVAEVEHEKIRDRLLNGRIKRSEREKRLTPGPKPTYGYRWDNEKEKNRLIIYEPEAAIIREVFERYAKGESMRGLARELAERGIPAPRTTWQQTTLSYILNNKRYTGEARSFYISRTLKDIIAHKGKTIKPIEDTILLPDGTIPRLVSDEIFAKVQQRIGANVQDSTRNSKKNIGSLLRSGFIECGYCGATMTISYSSKKNKLADGSTKKYAYPHYQCCKRMRAVKECRAGNISSSLLDRLVWEDLKELSKDTLLIEKAIHQALSQKSFQAEAQSLERSIKYQESLIVQFTEDINNPALRGQARTIVLGMLSDAQEALDKMKAELVEVKRGEIDYNQEKSSYTEILDWCKKVQDTKEEMTVKQKRDFLRLLGVVVKVYREDDKEHERYIINVKMLTIAKGISRNIQPKE